MGYRALKVAVGVILGLSSGPACTQSPFAVKIEGLGVLERLRPALAAKAIGCISCHATFESNIITDWCGVDSPHFLGNSTIGTQSPFCGNMVYPRQTNMAWKDGNGTTQAEAPFQTMTLNGYLISPKVTLTQASHDRILSMAYRDVTKPESISLKDFLSRSPYQAAAALRVESDPESVFWPGFTSNQPMFPASKIAEATKVVIRLPTSSEFDRLQSLGVPQPNFSAEDSSGFTRVTVAGTGSFIKASRDIYCNGSLYFPQESLVLAGDPENGNVINVHTGKRGCTLYVGLSVFISGKLQLAGPDRGGHIGIAAKHGIYAGYSMRRLFDRYFNAGNPRAGFWPYAFAERFKGQVVPPGANNPVPFNFVNPAAWQWELFQDGYSILRHDETSPLLKDACDNVVKLPAPLPDGPQYPPPYFVTNEAPVNLCGTRERAEIEHVILAAPSINWAYDGAFKGVMITEFPVGPAGSISFAFDDRFGARDFRLFPELEAAMGTPMLEVEE
jgi:hypothetical protein